MFQFSDNSTCSGNHPVVDYTPPSYITLLFTDLGVLTPSAVSDELIKLYLWQHVNTSKVQSSVEDTERQSTDGNDEYGGGVKSGVIGDFWRCRPHGKLRRLFHWLRRWLIVVCGSERANEEQGFESFIAEEAIYMDNF